MCQTGGFSTGPGMGVVAMLYRIRWVRPPPRNSGKWRFIGIPYYSRSQSPGISRRMSVCHLNVFFPFSFFFFTSTQWWHSTKGHCLMCACSNHLKVNAGKHFQTMCPIDRTHWWHNPKNGMQNKQMACVICMYAISGPCHLSVSIPVCHLYGTPYKYISICSNPGGHY